MSLCVHIFITIFFFALLEVLNPCKFVRKKGFLWCWMSTPTLVCQLHSEAHTSELLHKSNISWFSCHSLRLRVFIHFPRAWGGFSWLLIPKRTASLAGDLLYIILESIPTPTMQPVECNPDKSFCHTIAHSVHCISTFNSLQTRA